MKPECKKQYRKNGSVEIEGWYLNGKLHKTDGPAAIYYRRNGSIGMEGWYLNGELNRIDGPAFIYYRRNGSVKTESWYLNDEYIDPEENLIPIPKTEEEKIELINEIAFIKDGNGCIFIKEWLRSDKEFYDKYRMLIE